MSEALTTDRRRWDFSILDDEVIDDRRLTTQARAAYWSIVRHARITGQTEDPTEDLMAGAGIRKRPTWRRARAELASRGLIHVQPRSKLPPLITLLPVPKRRPDGPKTAPYRLGRGSHSGPSDGPKTAHDMGRKRPISYSETDTRKKTGLPPAQSGIRTQDQQPDAATLRRFAARFKAQTGRDLGPDYLPDYLGGGRT